MRSYRELWLWLGAAFLALFAALIAIGLAYFTKVRDFSFYTSWQAWSSLAAFLLAFACFCLAILGIPFPPWAKLKFPNIFIEFTGGADLETEHPAFAMPVRTFAYMVRITNFEAEQNASLTIDLFLKLVPGSLGRIGELAGSVINWPIDPDMHPLQMPILLTPGITVGGDLVYWVPRLGAPGRLVEPRQMRFKITDHISGQQRDIIMSASLGRFSRDDMTATLGGIQFNRDESEASEPQSSPEAGE